jgi:hypothetical protein
MGKVQIIQVDFVMVFGVGDEQGGCVNSLDLEDAADACNAFSKEMLELPLPFASHGCESWMGTLLQPLQCQLPSAGSRYYSLRNCPPSFPRPAGRKSPLNSLARSTFPPRLCLRILNNHSLQPLRVPILHIHRLYVTVQLLLRALLVVSLP